MFSITEGTKKRLPYMIAIVILLFIIKPSFFFTPNGNLRSYGTGYDADGYKKSFYSIHYFIFVFAIFLFFLIPPVLPHNPQTKGSY